VAPGVHALGSELVNWYLVEAEGGLIAIDAGLPGFAKTLDADLGRLGRSRTDVEAVVLTHSDGDHTGVAPVLQAAGARVLIHSADEPALRRPGPKKGDASPRHVLGNLWRVAALKVLGHTIRHGAKPARVEGAQTFADGDALDVPGRPRVVHTPGHTAGHCALLFSDRRVLFAGDALITHPLFVRDGGVALMPRFVNEDNAACRASLDVIEGLDADVVLPGHGEPWRASPAAAAQTARTNL
jgi:glyoxylase-like metal-dependent hydrolase (beta-lactamase superfamily II)